MLSIHAYVTPTKRDALFGLVHPRFARCQSLRHTSAVQIRAASFYDERRTSARRSRGALQILGSLKDTIEAPGKHTDFNVEPSSEALTMWQTAHAVCFDIDCTCCVNDSLDLLAEFMGVGEKVAELTNQAMNGALSLEEALDERLKLINCTPTDIQKFLQTYPAETRLTPNIKELIAKLQARGTAVYLISGGFRELCLPIANALGVPYSNLYANRMNWQVDDATGLPTKLVGFDERELTGHGMGKARVVEQLRQLHPYEIVVMIGDGITDLEAVQVTGGADLFIGYGGVVVREAVASQADWFVTNFLDLTNKLSKYKVAFVGSGAWACAAVKLIAGNVKQDDPADIFDDEVRMWVFEEEWEGGKLTDVINTQHQNPKYLPGVHIGENVVAVPELEDAVRGANVLVFCTPHQFANKICKSLKGKVDPDTIAISLTKGMRVRPDGPQLISQLIRSTLKIDCGVLMGANIAADIGAEQLSEATIAVANPEHGEVFRKMFETPYFYTTVINDVVGAEMCGTLKNAVAIGVGFVQGLGYGANTEAAILRAGLNEMRRLSKALYPTVRDDTFFESCGIADLVATSFGGRNRKVASEYAKLYTAGTPKTFEVLEAELLKGQKLQGALTANEVAEILHRRGWEPDYPLFVTISKIVNGILPPADIVRYREAYDEGSQPQQTADESASDPLGLSALIGSFTNQSNGSTVSAKQ